MFNRNNFQNNQFQDNPYSIKRFNGRYFDFMEKVSKSLDTLNETNRMLLEELKKGNNSNNTTETKPEDTNFKHIKDGVYFVRNQNGFNNSLYHLIGDTLLTKSEIRRLVSDHPYIYPCLAILTNKMLEEGKIRVTCLNINDINTIKDNMDYKSGIDNEKLEEININDMADDFVALYIKCAAYIGRKKIIYQRTENPMGGHSLTCGININDKDTNCLKAFSDFYKLYKGFILEEKIGEIESHEDGWKSIQLRFNIDNDTYSLRFTLSDKSFNSIEEDLK